jgi:hypothetical protein
LYFQDFQIAEEFGISDFPCLVYFEDEVPNVFEGMASKIFINHHHHHHHHFIL